MELKRKMNAVEIGGIMRENIKYWAAENIKPKNEVKTNLPYYLKVAEGSYVDNSPLPKIDMIGSEIEPVLLGETSAHDGRFKRHYYFIVQGSKPMVVEQMSDYYNGYGTKEVIVYKLYGENFESE